MAQHAERKRTREARQESIRRRDTRRLKYLQHTLSPQTLRQLAKGGAR